MNPITPVSRCLVLLALTLASSGSKVVLVDGDLRHPMIASIFGVAPGRNGLATTLLDIQVQALKRNGKEPDAVELAGLRDKVKASYEEKTDIRYAAARLWVDAIIRPEETRSALLTAIEVATRHDDGRAFKTGVLQV